MVASRYYCALAAAMSTNHLGKPPVLASPRGFTTPTLSKLCSSGQNMSKLRPTSIFHSTLSACKTPIASFSQIPTRGGRRLRRALSTESSDPRVHARPRANSRVGGSYGIFSLNKDRFKDYDVSLPILATTNGMIAKSISGMKDAILSGRKSRPDSFVERDDTTASSFVEEQRAYMAPQIRSVLSSTRRLSNTLQAPFNGVFQQQPQLPEPSFDTETSSNGTVVHEIMEDEPSEDSELMLGRAKSLDVECPGAPKNARSSRRASLTKVFGFTNINILRLRGRLGPPGLAVPDGLVPSLPLSFQSTKSGCDTKRRQSIPMSFANYTFSNRAARPQSRTSTPLPCRDRRADPPTLDEAVEAEELLAPLDISNTQLGPSLSL